MLKKEKIQIEDELYEIETNTSPMPLQIDLIHFCSLYCTSTVKFSFCRLFSHKTIQINARVDDTVIIGTYNFDEGVEKDK